MNDELHWDDVKMLVEVGRHGSMSAAGLAMGVAPSTVSRRVSRLEETFGVLLVERLVEGCRLTPHGHRLVAAGDTFRAQLDAHLVEVTQPDGPLMGTVTLTSGEGFAPFVMDTVRRYRAAHPQCLVRYVLGSDLKDVVRGEVDVALRTLCAGEPTLVYRKLADVDFGVFASQELVETWPANVTPEDVDVIGMLPPVDRAPYHVAARQAGFVRAVVRVSSVNAQIDAIRAGLGVGVLATQHASALVPVFEHLQLPPMEVFMVTRPQALKQPHIRAFVDAMYEEIRARPWGADVRSHV